jgi:hypothetical protein
MPSPITAYSEPGDGFILVGDDGTWAHTVAMATGTALADTAEDDQFCVSVRSAGWGVNYIKRAFFALKVLAAGLPADAIITGGLFNLAESWGASAVASALVEGMQASSDALALEDFGSVGSVELATHVATWEEGINTYVLNAAGLAYANAHKDLMKFAVREYASDFGGATPADDVTHGFGIKFSEYSGGDHAAWPNAVFTYTVPDLASAPIACNAHLRITADTTARMSYGAEPVRVILEAGE